MRSARAVALGVLLALAAVLGVAPAASAAPVTGIAWQVWGSVTFPYGAPALCPTGHDPFAPGQVVQVQVWNGTAWVTKGSATATSSDFCLYIPVFGMVGKPGRYTIRAVTQSGAGAPVLTADTVITARAATLWLEPQTAEFTATTSRKAVSVRLDAADGQFVDLFRRDGTRWVTVARVTAPRSGQGVTVTLAVPAKAGLAAYRVVSQGSTWIPQTVSATFTIHQTDVARHSAYLATARQHIAGYCPKTPIFIDTPRVAGAGQYGTVGLATYWHQGGAPGQNSLTTRIELRSGLSPAALKHTALHECAHVVQYRAVVEGRYAADTQRAQQIYGGYGTEPQADCMAVLYSKLPQYMSYIASCSSAQMTEAHRIWRAYGLKYQAATYTW